MISLSKKWKISLFSLLIFLIVVHPFTYQLTDSILGQFVGRISQGGGCPTSTGLMVHGLVYLLIVRYSMDLHLFS